VVICPSVSGEGSSGVIKEGLAAGKRVIASNLTANKELIDDRINGILFQNRSDESLAQTLELALSGNPFISIESIKQKVNQFDCSNTIQQHIDLYHRTLNQ